MELTLDQVHAQIDHDEAVRLCALSLLYEGYEVRARIEGWFDAPDYVNGYRPDIVARKGDNFILVEIRKGDVDWPKLAAFERLQRERENFRVMIVSPEKAISESGIVLGDQR